MSEHESQIELKVSVFSDSFREVVAEYRTVD